MGTFQFVVLSTLRSAQLIRGCRPRVSVGDHKKTFIAQCEVAQGMVTALAYTINGAEPATTADPATVGQPR